MESPSAFSVPPVLPISTVLPVKHDTSFPSAASSSSQQVVDHSNAAHLDAENAVLRRQIEHMAHAREADLRSIQNLYRLAVTATIQISEWKEEIREMTSFVTHSVQRIVQTILERPQANSVRRTMEHTMQDALQQLRTHVAVELGEFTALVQGRLQDFAQKGVVDPRENDLIRALHASVMTLCDSSTNETLHKREDFTVTAPFSWNTAHKLVDAVPHALSAMSVASGHVRQLHRSLQLLRIRTDALEAANKKKSADIIRLKRAIGVYVTDAQRRCKRTAPTVAASNLTMSAQDDSSGRAPQCAKNYSELHPLLGCDRPVAEYEDALKQLAQLHITEVMIGLQSGGAVVAHPPRPLRAALPDSSRSVAANHALNFSSQTRASKAATLHRGTRVSPPLTGPPASAGALVVVAPEQKCGTLIAQLAHQRKAMARLRFRWAVQRTLNEILKFRCRRVYAISNVHYRGLRIKLANVQSHMDRLAAELVESRKKRPCLTEMRFMDGSVVGCRPSTATLNQASQHQHSAASSSPNRALGSIEEPLSEQWRALRAAATPKHTAPHDEDASGNDPQVERVLSLKWKKEDGLQQRREREHHQTPSARRQRPTAVDASFREYVESTRNPGRTAEPTQPLTPRPSATLPSATIVTTPKTPLRFTLRPPLPNVQW